MLTSDPTNLPAGVTTDIPTKAHIMVALANVSSRAQPGDTVVF